MAKTKKRDADDEVNAQVIKALTESIVFLTQAKRKLFPDSVIQARGYLGDGPISMEKRLIWLSPHDEQQQAIELSDGARTTAAWLQEVAKLRPIDFAVHIAGDAGPVAGMLVDRDNETNWMTDMYFDEDGTANATWYRIPPAVLSSMHEAARRQL